ncbi:GumC family protein [Methylobacterium radiodurans]|uniref:Lipopolysaccharide biosynthesis protein n=1 Tax=Methylobacterium radiodurans TaxID=2202828 RepID=A0A2U8VXG3_9HYPH|nr:GumC family protein [Methylobacterium radiodurans]AWN37960.1 lipopolysaccharide biosynthesis protein [Methylobacterium radiodurans]
MSRSSPRATHEGRSSGEGVSVAELPGLLRRSWAWILLPTLAAAVAAAAFVQVVPPRYTAEAKLLLESRDPAFARTPQERADQTTPIDEQAVASQAQVMMSRDLAREAVRRLKLVGNPEFDAEAEAPGPLRQALMLMGLARNPLDRPAEERVLDAFLERLLVYPAGKSRILTVEFRSRDPDLAASGANTVAEIYLGSLEAAKVDTARYASTWLGGNIDTLRRRVTEAEAKVEAFRAKNGLVAAAAATGQRLTSQQLGELSTQLSQARTIQADLAGRVKSIKEMIKDGRAFEIPDVANNELIRRTIESRITVRAQLALESRTLLPAHPRIKELTAQVGELDAQIKAAADRIVRTLENDARIASSRVESLQAAVDGQRDVVVKGNSSEVELRALEREAKAQREQLESYLGRYREAAARDAESATPADARIVSRAVRPEQPSFPKKLPILAFSTLLAFLLSSGAVVGRRLLAEPGPGAPRGGDAPWDGDAPEGGDGPGGRGRSVRRAEPYGFPEAMPPNRWDGGAANADVPERPARPAASGAPDAAPVAEFPEAEFPEAPAEDRTAAPGPAAFTLGPLVDRLGRGPRRAAGRTVLVVETEPRRDGDLPDALARHLAADAATLAVDLNGPEEEADEPGLTDLVAGEAAFQDVIQADGGLQRIATGSVDTQVLLDEPEVLATTVDATAEAYAWIVFRLRLAPDALDLLTLLAPQMDSVILASNASADDPALGELFGLVEDAGAGQVLVAQDRPANRPARRPTRTEEPMELRLSAA